MHVGESHSLSMWFRPANITDVGNTLSDFGNVHIYQWLKDLNVVYWNGGANVKETLVDCLVVGNFIHFGYTYDTTTNSLNMFLDGVAQTPDAKPGDDPADNPDYHIGSAGGVNWCEGLIDEVRFIQTCPSNAWIKADYISQTDALLAYFPREDYREARIGHPRYKSRLLPRDYIMLHKSAFLDLLQFIRLKHEDVGINYVAELKPQLKEAIIEPEEDSLLDLHRWMVNRFRDVKD